MNTTMKLEALMVTLLLAGCSSNSKSQDQTSGVDSGGEESGTDEAGADAGGDDASPAECVYPSGPYGVTVGKVLDPNLLWQGYVPGATTASTVKITDFYDCDGTKGLNAIVIDSAGQWCVACQSIAQEIPTWLSSSGDGYTKLGIRILNLVIQNNDYEPATLTTAEQWRTLWKLTDIYVVADPNDTFPTATLPYELLVDPRTMKVAHNLSNDTSVNSDGSDPQVTALAKKNATTSKDAGK